MGLTEPAGCASRAKAAVASLLRSLAAQGDEIDTQAATAITDVCTSAVNASVAHMLSHSLSSSAPKLEIERLRQERDASVQQEHAALRRERDAAVAKAARRGVELESTARELATLRELHAVSALKAKHAAAASAAEAASKAEALERALAANAELAAAGAQQKLRIKALETKQTVLFECFQAMEAELLRLHHQQGGSAARCRALQQQLAVLPPAAQGPPIGSSELANVDRVCGNRMRALGEGGDVYSPLLSGSHLTLAAHCAELQCQLAQQRQQAEAASSAAAIATEQAEGLRLLLARQASAGAGSGPGAAASTAVTQRLEAACEQLEKARRAEMQLRRLLTEVSGS